MNSSAWHDSKFVYSASNDAKDHVKNLGAAKQSYTVILWLIFEGFLNN